MLIIIFIAMIKAALPQELCKVWKMFIFNCSTNSKWTLKKGKFQ